MSLTKEQLLSAKFKTEIVSVPELGGEILIQEPDAATYERLNASDYPLGKDGKVSFNPVGHMARWVIATARTTDRSPLFVEADLAAVSAMPYGLLRRLFDATERVSGLKATAVADAAKNS